MKIYVVRHGQTSGNVERIMDGCRRDIPLNETGLEQARIARDQLKGVNLDMIICSPLIRTRQTADILNINNAPIVYDDRLLERDCGEFTGNSFDCLDLDVYWNYYDTTKYESVEPLPRFMERVYDYLDYLKEVYSEKTIMLVTHGGVSMAIHSYVNGIPSDGCLRKVFLKNCEIAMYEI